MKETRSKDGDKTTSAWTHKILAGIDPEGHPHAYLYNDVLGWADAKRYIGMVRFILNDQYHRLTGQNCPVFDDDPAEPEIANDGLGLLKYIVIGTEWIHPPGEPPRDVVRLFVPDDTARMKGLADHLERLIHVIDAIKASRWYRRS